MTVTTQYTATSLADIAASYHAKSKEAERVANIPGRTKTDYKLWLREADVWRQAAVVLENITLVSDAEAALDAKAEVEERDAKSGR